MSKVPEDKSNGYDEAAERFLSTRSPSLGASTLRQWSQTLSAGSSVLDLGCGHGVPVSQVLNEAGFTLYGLDASPKLIESFRKRFPIAHAECSGFEDSEFFRRTFDGVVAWGLIFLLRPNLQSLLIRKVAKALNPGGMFLFTSPKEMVTWQDALTSRESVSLGADRYHKLLKTDGLVLVSEMWDEGNNYYYSARKP